jgi:hypothetical protein
MTKGRMIFLLYYVFYVVYVVKKMIIVLMKYQFPIDVISAKTRNIFDYHNQGLFQLEKTQTSIVIL